MKVTIEKNIKIEADIPNDKLDEYFGGFNEPNFIYWASLNIDLEPLNAYDYAEVWVTEETPKNIKVKDAPENIQSEYTESDISKIIKDREAAEHCYECGGYGDDFYTDENGDLQSFCDSCPFNPSNQD